MIKLERTAVMNMENAVRGARNPMNSWDRSDSYTDESGEFIIGPNDMDLLKRLRASGTDHRKYLRQFIVSVDITAPLYWWKEFDTYKVATVANSCSTMHKLHSAPITLDDFSCEKMTPDALKEFSIFVSCIEKYRLQYVKMLKENDGKMNDIIKQYWWNMIQMLPSSYNQMRTITMNYETLNNIVKSRSGHKQDEWRVTFMDWIRNEIPYSKELIFGE